MSDVKPIQAPLTPSPSPRKRGEGSRSSDNIPLAMRALYDGRKALAAFLVLLTGWGLAGIEETRAAEPGTPIAAVLIAKKDAKVFELGDAGQLRVTSEATTESREPISLLAHYEVRVVQAKSERDLDFKPAVVLWVSSGKVADSVEVSYRDNNAYVWSVDQLGNRTPVSSPGREITHVRATHAELQYRLYVPGVKNGMIASGSVIGVNKGIVIAARNAKVQKKFAQDDVRWAFEQAGTGVARAIETVMLDRLRKDLPCEARPNGPDWTLVCTLKNPFPIGIEGAMEMKLVKPDNPDQPLDFVLKPGQTTTLEFPVKVPGHLLIPLETIPKWIVKNANLHFASLILAPEDQEAEGGTAEPQFQK